MLTVCLVLLQVLSHLRLRRFHSMGRKVQACLRAVSAVDVDDVQCLYVPARQACSVCVFGLAAFAREGLNLELCLSLCPC